jgi:hypothetical protein
LLSSISKRPTRLVRAGVRVRVHLTALPQMWVGVRMLTLRLVGGRMRGRVRARVRGGGRIRGRVRARGGVHLEAAHARYIQMRDSSELAPLRSCRQRGRELYMPWSETMAVRRTWLRLGL